MKWTRRMLSLLMCIVLMAGVTITTGERALWDCPKCGHQGNRTDFCSKCGWKAPSEGTNTDWELWTCPSCGAALNWGRFCAYCGKPKPTPEPTAEPTPEPTPEPTEALVWNVIYKVYYRDENGTLLYSDTLPMNGSGTVTYTILADDGLVPAGYVLFGEDSAEVTVRDGKPEPSRVSFVYRNLAAPTPTSPPTPTPEATMAPVTGLRVQNVSASMITMTWNSVSGAEQYKLEIREATTETWLSLGQTKETTARFEALKAGTQYDIRITAISGGKEGAPKTSRTWTKADAFAESGIKAGDYVTFGQYEQDNNSANGKEPIEWLVLEVRDGKALVLSRYGLDAKPYNTEQTEVTWETCSLRQWLNGEFMNAAFSSAERGSIEEREVDNSAGQCYGGWSTSGGKNTRDKVYLLSYGEAHKYLGVEHWEVEGSGDNMKSRTSATAYAKAQGAVTSDVWDQDNKTTEGEYACWWWLRSPGCSQYDAADVFTVGCLGYDSVSSASVCVRPALWVNLESLIF